MAACFWGMGLKAYSEPMPQKQGPRAAMDGDQEGGHCWEGRQGVYHGRLLLGHGLEGVQ